MYSVATPRPPRPYRRISTSPAACSSPRAFWMLRSDICVLISSHAMPGQQRPQLSQARNASATSTA